MASGPQTIFVAIPPYENCCSRAWFQLESIRSFGDLRLKDFQQSSSPSLAAQNSLHDTKGPSKGRGGGGFWGLKRDRHVDQCNGSTTPCRFILAQGYTRWCRRVEWLNSQVYFETKGGLSAKTDVDYKLILPAKRTLIDQKRPANLSHPRQCFYSIL